VPEFHLSLTAAGKCVLKEEGVTETHEFEDILAAITFISFLDMNRDSTLTIYDPLGNVAFRDLLSSR